MRMVIILKENRHKTIYASARSAVSAGCREKIDNCDINCRDLSDPIRSTAMAIDYIFTNPLDPSLHTKWIPIPVKDIYG